MDATRNASNELQKLVDRHIELCELFDGAIPPARRNSPLLVTMNDGKAMAECLSDLVDNALVAYEVTGFAQDPTIYCLRILLSEAIEKRI